MGERYLGRSGLKVSLAGLGANNFGERISNEVAEQVINTALDHGVNFIDTADVYGRGGSETVLGQVLGARRNEVILATKFGNPVDPDRRVRSGSRRYIIQAVEASLSRLKTDWIDLYQYHRPDPGTPIDETLRALDDLVHAGKVRYLGVSNFPAWQVADAQWTASTNGLERIISSQNHYNLVERSAEAELIPALKSHGIGLLPYFPLGGGFLSGKYRRGAPPPADSRFARGGRGANRFLTDANFDLLDKFEVFAASRGKTVSDLALAWLAAQPVVASVIVGASTPEQVKANVKSLEWQLTPEDLSELNSVVEKAPLQKAA